MTTNDWAGHSSVVSLSLLYFAPLSICDYSRFMAELPVTKKPRNAPEKHEKMVSAITDYNCILSSNGTNVYRNIM